jgi:hypothetical protein
MRTPEQRTEDFILKSLPIIAGAPAERAEEAYLEYTSRLSEVMGDTSDPRRSDFSWPILQEIIYDRAGGKLVERFVDPQEVVRAAAKTSIAATVGGQVKEIRIHDPIGTSVTVSGMGIPLAAERIYNPRVPTEYGCGDPYVFAKIGEAFTTEHLVHTGADWGEGYEEITRIKRAAGMLGENDRPHIGGASLHAETFDPEDPRKDRTLLAVSGTSGRTITSEFRQYVDNLADFDAIPRPKDHDDFLAGLLDTMSGKVAAQVAVHGPSREAHIVELPDPNHIDYAYVDWN